MYDIITIGEPMVLFAATTVGPLESSKSFIKLLSGAEANVAIGLSRLEHNVSYITQISNDPLGKFIYNCLTRENIDVSYIRFTDKYQTGIQIKEKTEGRDPKVISYRKGSAVSYIYEKLIDSVDFTGVKCIHVTGIPLAISKSFRNVMHKFVIKARDNNIKVSFDPNLRMNLWDSKDEMIEIINSFSKFSDIIMPGIEEGKLLTGYDDPEKIADFYLDRGVKDVVIKTGDKGAYIKNKNENCIVPGFKVDKVVDTVGAGDGFAVGVLSGFLENLSLREAVLRGNAIGAIQVTHLGDNDGLPNREQLERFINERK